MRPEQYGGMYTTTTKEPIQDATIIIGTLLIHYFPAIVLFDLGSSHTFQTKAFDANLNEPIARIKINNLEIKSQIIQRRF